MKLHPTLTPPVNLTYKSDVDEQEFVNNQQDLVLSSQILGDMKMSPDHIVITGISFSLVLLLTLILVCILYCLMCGPGLCKCQREKTRVHRDSV